MYCTFCICCYNFNVFCLILLSLVVNKVVYKRYLTATVIVDQQGSSLGHIVSGHWEIFRLWNIRYDGRKHLLIRQLNQQLSPVSTTRVDGPRYRPELTGDRFPLPVKTGRVDGRAFPLAELTGRQHGPCWRVMETGQPSTRVVNSGSVNRALVVEDGYVATLPITIKRFFQTMDKSAIRYTTVAIVIRTKNFIIALKWQPVAQ